MSKSSLVTYTKLVSKKDAGREGKKIDKIFLHHMAGNLTVKQCGEVFNTRAASAHYGVNGTAIGQYVDEADTAWHCGNWPYNLRSIGIELANDGGANTNWHVSDTTIATAIKLIADICKRNGITKLNYTGDLSGNFCMHKWAASTACPGWYLASKFQYIADEVNKMLAGSSSSNTNSNTNSGKKDTSFKVRVSIDDLYIRTGPGKSYKTKGFIKPGVYTITQKKGTWGKLKSGAGWISLNYVTKL